MGTIYPAYEILEGSALRDTPFTCKTQNLPVCERASALHLPYPNLPVREQVSASSTLIRFELIPNKTVITHRLRNL